MGQNVHSTLTDFLSIVPVENRTVETAEDLLRRKWRRNREGFADSEEERQWGERALAQLRWFVNTQRVDVHPLMLERFHEAPVSENLVLNGRIDRIDRIDDGSLHVIDYKTGRMPEQVDSFQLLLYALILSRTLTYPVSKVSYLYLDDGMWHTFDIAEGNLHEARGGVLEVAGAIDQETKYPEVIGLLCRFCDFLEICEARTEFESAATSIEPIDF